MGNTASYPPKVLVPLAGLLFSKNLSSSGQVPTLTHSSPFRWKGLNGAEEREPLVLLRIFQATSSGHSSEQILIGIPFITWGN